MQRLAKLRDRKPFPATGKTHASHAEKSRSFNPSKPKAGSPPSRPAQGQRWSLQQHLAGRAPDKTSEKKPSRSPELVEECGGRYEFESRDKILIFVSISAEVGLQLGSRKLATVGRMEFGERRHGAARS